MTNGGQAVLTFTVATSRQYKRGNDWKEETQWHRCVLWGDRAEAVLDRVVKGAYVLVEGNIEYREYTDRDGLKRNTTEIKVRSLNFCGHRAPERQNASHQDNPPYQPPSDDDIPF
jgi:single-strand DNA-binding protein